MYLQIALLGSITWFMLLSWDLLSTLRNPFVDHTEKLKYYHIFAWSTSILSGVVLLSGGDLIGVSYVCIRWIKSTDHFVWFLFCFHMNISSKPQITTPVCCMFLILMLGDLTGLKDNGILL
jgi:hypothetical protein